MLVKDYMNDGANYQVQAVLAYLKPNADIEESWNEKGFYDADIRIGRWENCREQGYIVYLKSFGINQLNIAFFEHRNSDRICAIKWEQNSINSLTIDTAEFPKNVYSDKYDVSFSVAYGQALEMANWISEQFSSYYLANKKPE